MFEHVRAFLDAHHFSLAGDTMLVAVSGGVDSMALLHVLQQMEAKVAAAHMNYGLRGASSDEDQAFVEAYCTEHQLPFHTKNVSIDLSGGTSIQMQARELRYAWFEELKVACQYDYVATAHHLNDSMETTLLNLIRGTGIHGLTGIPSKNDAFLRPFTFVTKAEIMTYATSLHLTWRSDASNSEVKYQRNKIRNLVVPILEEINPSLIATFRNTLERLEGTAQVVNERVKEIKKLHFKSGKPNELSLGWFQHNSMGLVILSELLKPYQVSYTMVKDIAQTHLSGKLFYSDSHQLLYDRGKLLITPLKEDVHAVLNIPKPGIYAWQNVQIQIEQVSAEAFSASTETNTVFVDATTVDFPITVRSWQQGDWFVPLGMSGKKKLSDFMIDRKIPLTLKQHIPIFCCGAHIIWVGGYQIDDRFKVRPTSKELLKIKLSSRV